jgi:hypothetical protein
VRVRRVCPWEHRSPATRPAPRWHTVPASGRSWAMATQQTCHILAVLGLLGRQPVEHLHTGRPMAVMFTLQSLLECGFILTQGRYGTEHGSPSGRARFTKIRRIAYLCIRLPQNSYNNGFDTNTEKAPRR